MYDVLFGSSDFPAAVSQFVLTFSQVLLVDLLSQLLMSSLILRLGLDHPVVGLAFG